MVIGSIIAGVPNPLDPMRLLRLVSVISITAFALISMMFLLMVRVTDPLAQAELDAVLRLAMSDDIGAFRLDPDGSWHRRTPVEGRPALVNFQDSLLRRISGRGD